MKVLNELQLSYDELLHKYAAAENALDKVSSSLALPFKCIITAARKTTFYQIHEPALILRCDLGQLRPLVVEIAKRLS